MADESAARASDLLFGVLALQAGLISRGALFAAYHATLADPAPGLAAHLGEQGAVSHAQRTLIEGLVAEHRRRQRGDVEAALTAVLAARADRAALPPADDLAQWATLGFAGPSSDASFSATVADLGDGATIAGPDVATVPNAAAATVVGTMADMGFSVAEATVGRGLGERFEVVSQHASGGLGVVFLARDGELNREVALKRIKDRLADDPVSRARFLLEAEVTGGLEHPGVVPVYGLGTSADGRLYYAMRFIRGESLADAIAAFHADDALKLDPGARSLALRKLLRRFLDVCNTIEYAHGRGVLHRDIKPDNVMVGRYGETLVVDWGIAKVTGRTDPTRAAGERPLSPASGVGATETLAGTTIGTPAYMSPEQASGAIDALGPPSDVYSLGATLYTILTNKPAFEGRDLTAILIAVRNGTFPPPRERDRSIDPALEAICLKAMALLPAGRYPTARALADDLERWMADEPVSARPDPPSERVRRWMRRRRTAVTAGVAAVLVAMVGLAVVLVVQERSNRELRAANNEVQARFALAQKAIRTFHTGVTEDLLLSQKEFAELRDKLLRSARDFYGELEQQLKGRSDRASREALGRAYFEVGELTSTIGSKPDALEAHRRALQIRQSLARDEGATPASLAEVGRSMLAIGMLEKETGRLDESEADLTSGRVLLEGLPPGPTGAGDPEVLADLAVGYERLGLLLDQTGRSVNAMGAHERARDIRARLVKALPDEPRHQARLAKSYQDISELLNKADRTDDALASCEQARDLREALVAAHPAVKNYRFELAANASLLGVLLDKTGRTKEALASHVRAAELLEALVRASPTSAKFQDKLGGAHFHIAWLQTKTGQPDAAVASYGKARDIFRELAESNPKVPDYRSDAVAATVSLGSALVRVGRIDEALRTFEGERAVLDDLVKAQPTVPLYRDNLALIHGRIGKVLSDNGRWAESLAAFTRARDIQRALVTAEPAVAVYGANLAWSEHALGEELARAGRPAEALDAIGRARALLAKLSAANPDVPTYRAELAFTDLGAGQLLSEIGRSAEAEASCVRARDALRALAAAHPTVIGYRAGLAQSDIAVAALLVRSTHPADALEPLSRAAQTWDALMTSSPSIVAYPRGLVEARRALGDLFTRLGRFDRAAAEYETARALARANAAAFPLVADFPVEAALCDEGLGVLALRDGHADDAVERFRHAALALAALPRPRAADLYACSRNRARLLALEPGPGRHVDVDAAEVVATLRRAIAAGFRDAPALAAEPAFDPIRARPDFLFLPLDMIVASP